MSAWWKAAATAILLITAFCGLSAPLNAARNSPAGPVMTSGDELVVFEVDPCIYCELFRRDVLPRYIASSSGRQVPIVFADANRSMLRRAQLTSPIRTVPTFVLIRRGREVGRISGYTGPSLFFPLVNALIRGSR